MFFLESFLPMHSYFLPYISLPLSEFISILWGYFILPWECYFYDHLWNSLQVTWLPLDDIWTLNSTTWLYYFGTFWSPLLLTKPTSLTECPAIDNASQRMASAEFLSNAGSLLNSILLMTLVRSTSFRNFWLHLFWIHQDIHEHIKPLDPFYCRNSDISTANLSFWEVKLKTSLHHLLEC